MTRDYRAEALASPNWRWVPGMRWVVRRDAPLEDYGGRVIFAIRPDVPMGAVPDWTDPATLGCLLHRVRELWESPTAYARLYEGTWGIYGLDTGYQSWGYSLGYPTEADALCAALVAAPLLRPEVPRADRD